MYEEIIVIYFIYCIVGYFCQQNVLTALSHITSLVFVRICHEGYGMSDLFSSLTAPGKIKENSYIPAKITQYTFSLLFWTIYNIAQREVFLLMTDLDACDQ